MLKYSWNGALFIALWADRRPTVVLIFCIEETFFQNGAFSGDMLIFRWVQTCTAVFPMIFNSFASTPGNSFDDIFE